MITLDDVLSLRDNTIYKVSYREDPVLDEPEYNVLGVYLKDDISGFKEGLNFYIINPGNSGEVTGSNLYIEIPNIINIEPDPGSGNINRGGTLVNRVSDYKLLKILKDQLKV